MSLSHEIARMISDYLGPAVQRTGSVGATLNALRVRLETNEVTDDPRADLCWQVREAIRTEFFKIKYPAPPPSSLLALVTKTEILFAGLPGDRPASNRPFYFPGTRVSIPHENGVDRRHGTTLQLRIKSVEAGNLTEALAHLDGERGGGFRWVQTAALAPLSITAAMPTSTPIAVRQQPASMPTIAPRPPPTAIYSAPAAASMPVLVVSNSMPPSLPQQNNALAMPKQVLPKSRKAQSGRSTKQTKQLKQQAAIMRESQSKTQGGQQRLVESSGIQGTEGKDSRPYLPAHTLSLHGKMLKDDPRTTRVSSHIVTQDLIPPTFIPDALRSVSPPPRKRLRGDVSQPLSLVSGSISDAAIHLCRQYDSAFNANIQNVNQQEFTANTSKTEMDSHGPSSIFIAEGDKPRLLSRPSPPTLGNGDQRYLVTAQEIFSQPARTLNALIENVIVIEKLVARRYNVSSGGVIEYCVKWYGVDWNKCTWESRDALIQDVPGLVLEFDTRHPENPSKAFGIARKPPAGEEKQHSHRMTELKALEEQRNSEVAQRRQEEESPILIPTWIEQPLIEITFSGMVLQVRRDEGTLFDDASAAARDLKRRRARFKQEYPEQAKRLLVPTKAEIAAKERNDAKVRIETSMRERKRNGMRPIFFPRGLGTVARTEVARPISLSDIEKAPPSWEGYFSALGLECIDWSRDHPPDMPTASMPVQKTMEHATMAIEPDAKSCDKDFASHLSQDLTRREHKESTDAFRVGDRDLLKDKHVTQDNAHDSLKTQSTNFDKEAMKTNISASHVFTEKSLFELRSTVQGILSGKARELPTGEIEFKLDSVNCVDSGVERRMLRHRNLKFAQAISNAQNVLPSDNDWYDPVWCCWRSSSVQQDLHPRNTG